MMNCLHPNKAERLLVIAAQLHRVYSEGPLEAPYALATQIRRLAERDGRRSLPTVRQLCADIQPDHEIEHIVVCPACGQMFDCRDRDQVDHHSKDQHEPKLAS
jgi:hypothetical protein